MKINPILPCVAGLALVALGGCEPAPEAGANENPTARTEAEATGARAGGAAERSGSPSAAQAGATVDDAQVVVFKSPTCGCCSAWVEHMRESGFQVEAVDLADYQQLISRKQEAGVPDDLESCHTALVGGYVIEGHVPAETVARLLRERPDIRGLAVPGMPIGSPGMEGADPEPYDVIAFGEDGSREVFERVDPR